LSNLLLAISLFIVKDFTQKIHPQVFYTYKGFSFCIYSGLVIFFNIDSLNKFDANNLKFLALRTLLSGFGMLFVILSLQSIRVNTCELILRTGNLMSVFMGYLILNEIVTIYDLYGLLSTLLGVVLILKPSFIFKDKGSAGDDKLIGVLFSFTTAFIISLNIVITKKVLHRFEEIFVLFFMGLMSCFIGIISIQIENINISINLNDLLKIMTLNIVEFCGMYLTFLALKYESVTKLAPFANSRILFSVFIVYITNGPLDFFDLFGVLIILITYIYISYHKIKMTTPV